jgi:methylenetetrahydrofolate reductase (NADPH)
VHGVHLMAYRQEETVAEIIERSGVLAGRVPWHPGRGAATNSNRIAS